MTVYAFTAIRLVLMCVLMGVAALPETLMAASPQNRTVRVVTVSQDRLRGPDESLMDDTLVRLGRAASFRPDIAVLPETFLRDTVERVPGPITRRLGEWARRNSSYLIFGLKTQTADGLYNSAILLDRKGAVVGQYEKMYPTEAELRAGIQPGQADPPVFQTDFGTIGIQICFDVNWWESWRSLKDKGAEIVFFPAAYPAASQTAMLALTNRYYVVSSTMDRPARIHDITGKVLAASGRFQQWAGAELHLGKRLFEIDYHMRKVREIQRKYGSRIEVVWYRDDDWFTLTSLDPELAVEDLIEEFELTPLADYHRRAAKAVDEARAKR